MFVIVPNAQYLAQDTNIVGINPQNNIESEVACTELCTQQGTKCVGTSYTQSSNTCYLKKQVKPNLQTNPGTDSTLRMSGPAGVSTQQLQTRNFAGGNLGAWTSTTSKFGGPFSVINGAANLSLPLSQSGTPFGSSDSAYLQQPISAKAGQNFFVQLNYGYTLNHNSSLSSQAGQVVCSIIVSTDGDTPVSLSLTSRSGALNVAQFPSYASGVLSSDASYLRTEFSCNGGQDASFALNSISFKTFDPSIGTNVIVPEMKQELQNTQFTDNGSIAPWTITITNDPNNNGTASPGSFEMCLPPQQQYECIGTLSQPVPLIELAQPYRVQGHIDVNIPNNAGTCNVLMGMSNNPPIWQQTNVTSSQGFDVDITSDSVGTDSQDFIGVQAFCTSTTVTMCITLSNVALTYNA